MPQQTDYHGFEIPVPYDISSEDTNVWGEILNNAFRHFDEEVILRGTASDQPPSEKQGRLFLDENDLRMQYDTGSNWEYMGVQAQFLDSQGHVLTTPEEIDFDSDISVSKSGSNRVKIDVDDSFVRNDGDTVSGTLRMAADLTDDSTGAVIWDASDEHIPEARVEQGSGSGLDADLLDGVERANLDWANTALAQSEVNVSHLGAADASYDTNGYDIVDAETTIWNASNGWVPSDAVQYNGLDADTLDGVELANIDWANTALAQSEVNVSHLGAADASYDTNGYDIVDAAATIWDTSAGHVPQSSVQQGAGSGLDADTVDAYQASALAVRGENETISGKWDFTSAPTAPNPSSQTEVATKDYVDSTAQSLEYKESVLGEQNAPPSSPSDGDRYLVDDSPSGDWSGHPNELAEYDGSNSAWVFEVANEGWSVFIEGTDSLKTYYNSDWILFGSTLNHSNLQGLGSDDHTQYVHTDGRRAMSANFGMGGNSITNIGTLGTTGGLNSIWPDNPSDGGDLEIGFNSQNTIRLGGGANYSLAAVEIHSGDLTDGSSNVIYDQSAGYVPQSAVQQGSGSGLNADTVDGAHKADLDSQYVDAAGDSMSGALTVNSTLDATGAVTFADFMDLQPIAEPATPSSGKRVFVDSADGGLKVKDTSGAVSTIAE